MTAYDSAVQLQANNGRLGRTVPEAQPTHVLRRNLLVGAAAMAAAPLTAPFIARAVEPIRIGLLLAKTGQIAAQTEYLANGSFLAMHERDNQIMGQPAELVWLDEPTPQAATQNMHKLVQENKVIAVLGGSLSSNALAEEAAATQLEDTIRLRQCSGNGHHRQELQSFHLPAQYPGRGAVPHADAVRAELRQAMVSYHRIQCVRTGYPADLTTVAAGRGGHRGRLG